MLQIYKEGKKTAREKRLQEFWCFPLCKYAAKGSVYVKHCNTELRKQVFPRLYKPAPWKYSTIFIVLKNFGHVLDHQTYSQKITKHNIENSVIQNKDGSLKQS